jgi:hypothetical protein
MVDQVALASKSTTSLPEWWAVHVSKSLVQILDNQTVRDEFNKHGLVLGSKAASSANPSYLSGSTFAMALMDSLLDPTKPLTAFTDVETAVQALPPSNLRDLLVTNIATANRASAQAQRFDTACDKVVTGDGHAPSRSSA